MRDMANSEREKERKGERTLPPKDSLDLSLASILTQTLTYPFINHSQARTPPSATIARHVLFTRSRSPRYSPPPLLVHSAPPNYVASTPPDIPPSTHSVTSTTTQVLAVTS